jgi:hypothetical protein
MALHRRNYQPQAIAVWIAVICQDIAVMSLFAGKACSAIIVSDWA